jgi:ribosome-associated protein
MLVVTPDIAIDEREIHEEFVRSSGPGGQNVNKVATAVKLRFNVAKSPSLPQPVRERLVRLAGKKITRDGVLIIDARRFRTQERNRKDAIERLLQLIRRAARKPKPRFKTKPSLASREKRLEKKRRRSTVKHRRQPVLKPEE